MVIACHRYFTIKERYSTSLLVDVLMLFGESGCFEEVSLTRSRVMLQSGIAASCQKHLDFVEPGTPWPDTDDEVTWPGSHDCGPPRQCPLEKSQMVIP